MTATGAGSTRWLDSAQPTYCGEATPPDGLDLEAVDVGFASDGDLAGRDLKGKAVFFYSTYARIITDVNAVDVKDLQRPAAAK